MFERILIKSGSNVAEPLLSIADMVDMMFYYGEVHVVVSQFELKQLLTIFGEDVLYELISSQRLIIHLCDQHLGVSKYGDFNSLGLFKHNFRSFDELLFNFHKVTINDFNENKRFVERFTNVLNEYTYPKEIQNFLYRDIENETLLSQIAQVFIKQYYPNYKDIENIHIKAEPAESSFMDFYKIAGNLRVDELNAIHHQMGYNGTFGYSTILLALGETHIDCYLAAELESEIITNNRWADVYKLRMNEAIKKAENSKDNIIHFQEMAANDFLSPGESFVKGLITPHELLKDLCSKDSVKFREWLSTIPCGEPLTAELYKAVQEQNSNKTWVKCVRSISQVVTGLINPALGALHTCLDGFVVDKLINGWKPSMFISNILTKEKIRKK